MTTTARTFRAHVDMSKHTATAGFAAGILTYEALSYRFLTKLVTDFLAGHLNVDGGDRVSHLEAIQMVVWASDCIEPVKTIQRTEKVGGPSAFELALEILADVTP